MPMESCYPCQTYARACVLERETFPVERKRMKEVPVLLNVWPEGRWFDVALWSSWPSMFPRYTSYVQASSAFDAIAQLMRHYGLWKVAYASSRALDGSIIYRCYALFVLPETETGTL